MQNKENRSRKKSQERTKSYSHDRGQKPSNFTSMIFESGRNSLCSPRVNSIVPASDRHENYMQYITTDRVAAETAHPRASLGCKTRKSVTPTPRQSFASQFAQAHKSNVDKENSKAKHKNSKTKPASKSPFAKYKPLFVKGNNIAKCEAQKKKEVGNRPASVKKKQKAEKVKGEDKQEQKQKKLVQKLFKGIQFHRDLGKGAHALVKSGVDWNNKRKIAVKIYDKNELRDNQLRSIEREIEILGSLNHPSIIKLYEIIESFKKINLVMEYGGGNSVDQYMRNKKRGYLQEVQAKNIFRQILNGVIYLHDNRIAHRDIKTDNILLNKYLKVKIIDFGFSIKVEGTSAVNNFCGTPTYMSPEVAQRQPYNPFLSDRWSLGILLYSMLNGRCPFRALSQKQLFAKICQGQYEFESHVSVQARQLIGKFLVIDPQARVSPQEALKYRWLNFS